MPEHVHSEPDCAELLYGDGAIRRTSLYGSGVENTFGGTLSFLRRRYTRDIEGADVVVSGIPFDLASPFRPGARFGPAAIRALSVMFSDLKPFPYGVDIFEELAVADYGDCWLDAHSPANIPEAIAGHARAILASGAAMLTFGGDSAITYPLLKAHAQRLGQALSLIRFGAHGIGPVHGPIDAERSVEIGVRSGDGPPGIHSLDARWVHAHGPQKTLERILDIVGDRACYLSIDIGCLDPSAAPGTGRPLPGGLTSAQALHIVRGLAPARLVGMDIVEVSPPYDRGDITALVAANLALEMLCVLHRRKTGQA
ncbi:arginase family protein [Crenobacter cavernae]|uniref:Agmatinase n=1 Tax=Crenobacter cavernae TaxID=2290923 RepID=A0ABY0FGV6_9NEIS|nr:arginase family protein [Crenobacter cavernae]RXZ45616.1 agmatinase [Crenobacter cavernae]